MTELTSARIMVCDDSITNTAILASLLNEHGFSQVDTVNNPVKVLNQMRDAQYDLMLLDLEMPKLNGIELIEMLKKRSGYRRQFPYSYADGCRQQRHA